MPRGNPRRHIPERADWTEIWHAALGNMPRRMGDKRGSPSVLRALLGYKVKDLKGRNSASQHFHTAASHGQKPRDAKRALMLQALAGPHGKILVYALATIRGVDLSKYPKWP